MKRIVDNNTLDRALDNTLGSPLNGGLASQGDAVMARPVSRRQDALIVGGLLGDLHVQKTSASTERCRLRICHSVAQREYVD